MFSVLFGEAAGRTEEGRVECDFGFGVVLFGVGVQGAQHLDACAVLEIDVSVRKRVRDGMGGVLTPCLHCSAMFSRTTSMSTVRRNWRSR